MEISIHGARILFEIPIFGGIKVTSTQTNSLIAIAIIFIICKILTHNLKVIPASKRQIVAEFLVEKARGLVGENMGEKLFHFTPFIMAIMGLSVVSSLLSLLGLYPPTADLNTLLGWSISVFFVITYQKLKKGLGSYLKGYLEPFALFAPLNVIGEVATPVSMAFRHFGNVMSGTVISTLLYAALALGSKALLSWAGEAVSSIPILQVGVPAVFSLYFDIFSSCIQALIFSMLTMINVANAAAD